MGRLVLELLPLALGAAFSPTLFIVEMLALSSGPGALRRGWAVVLGSGLVLAALTGLTLLAGRTLAQHHPHRSVDGVIDGLAALALLVLALRSMAAARRRDHDAPSPLAKRLEGSRLVAWFGIGAVGMLTNFSTLVLYFPAMRLITHRHHSSAEELVATALLFLITLLPVLAPALVLSLLGRRAEGLLERLGSWTQAHASALGIGVELLFALLLGLKAANELL